MAENRFPCSPRASGDTVCIETNRILDSCRDRDCYEKVRVYLSDYGNELLERTGAIRAKSAKLMDGNGQIIPMQVEGTRAFCRVCLPIYGCVLCLFET